MSLSDAKSSSSRNAVPDKVPLRTGDVKVFPVNVVAIYPVATAVPCHVPLEIVPTVTRLESPG